MRTGNPILELYVNMGERLERYFEIVWIIAMDYDRT
jgi:hypothetical protein